MRRPALAPCVLALTLALTACGDGSGSTDEEGVSNSDSSAEEPQNEGHGGEDEDTVQARTAAEDFLEALRNGDGEVGCALIDEEAHASVALTTSDSANATTEQECEPAFPTYAEEFNGADVAEVGEVEMGTDESGEIPIATVPLEYSEEVEGETAEELLFWLMDDGEWRIRTVPFGGFSG